MRVGVLIYICIIYIHIVSYTYLYVCIYIYTIICTYIDLDMNIVTYMHIYIHMYIYIYIHMHVYITIYATLYRPLHTFDTIMQDTPTAADRGFLRATVHCQGQLTFLSYRFGIAETRDDNRLPEVEKDFDVAGLGGHLADFFGEAITLTHCHIR